MTADRWIRRIFKPLIFAAGLVPAVLLTWWAVTDQLSANPITDITHETGIWILRFVLITLAITPLRRLTGWHWLIRFRRMLGNFAFFYGCLHFSTYMVLDHFFDFATIVEDIAMRPFITVGFAGFVLMIPLAVTSTAAMKRRLGGRNWQRLHRLIYVTAILGVVHYWWGVKADILRPQIYAAIATVLLGYRIVAAIPKRSQRTAVPAGASSSLPSN